MKISNKTKGISHISTKLPLSERSYFSEKIIRENMWIIQRNIIEYEEICSFSSCIPWLLCFNVEFIQIQILYKTKESKIRNSLTAYESEQVLPRNCFFVLYPVSIHHLFLKSRASWHAVSWESTRRFVMNKKNRSSSW